MLEVIFKKYFKIIVFCFALMFFVVIQDVKADFSRCGITSVDPQFQVKANDGAVVLAIDNNGNMDGVTGTINWSAPSGSFSDSFIIKNSSGEDIFVFNENNFYIPGDLNEEADQVDLDNINGDDFIIKNDFGVIVARFDADTGDIYIAGTACGFMIQIGSCEEIQMIGYPEYFSLCNDVVCNNKASGYPLDGNYILSNNIDCSATKNGGSIWDDGLFAGGGFDPIGTNPAPFKGNFDGNEKEIKDLYIGRSDEDTVGLFGKAQGAEIKDLGLINNEVSGNNWVGGLIGYADYSTTTNSYVTGNVSGSDSRIGGLVGKNNQSYIIDSSAAGNVNGIWWVGGLVGRNDESFIINSYAAGNVYGDWSLGGLVGLSTYSTTTNSYAIGNVDGSIGGAGGLIGLNWFSSSIINCYAVGNVNGDDHSVGGLVGYNDNSSIINSYTTGNVSGNSRVGGLIGYYENSFIENSYWNTEISGQALGCGVGDCTGAEGKTIDEMRSGMTPSNETTTYSNWDFEPTLDASWKLDTLNDNFYPCLTWQDNGTCPMAPIVINSCEELQMIGHDEYRGLCGSNCDQAWYRIYWDYVLLDDIDCSAIKNGGSIWDDGLFAGGGFDPIGTNPGPFIGNFNGKNNAINNLYISRENENYVGLFAKTKEAEISNLGLVDNEVYGKHNVGGLVGWNDNYSSIINSYATGNISGDSRVGGLVGNNYYSSIINSYATGDINSDSLDAFDASYGGLVGQNSNSLITNSYATGDVIGGSWAGGLAGNNNSSSIINSYATGNVNGISWLGSLIGQVSSDSLLVNLYWNTETSGQTLGCGVGDCTGAEGKVTTEMIQQATYPSWDFINTWNINENITYPCHKWWIDQGESCIIP